MNENGIAQKPTVPADGLERHLPTKKRKLSAEILPPRPSGPPPSWAFKAAGPMIEAATVEKHDCYSKDSKVIIPKIEACITSPNVNKKEL